MPHSLSLPRRCLAGVLAAALALAPAAGVMAQVPGATVADVLQQLDQRTAVRAGQPTAAEGGPVTQAAVGQTQAPTAKPDPFGATLFAAGGTPVSDAINPDYLIQPGDRIAVNISGGAVDGAAGGQAAQALGLVVDPQGNVFLPEVGVVHVAGARADALQPTIQAAASRTFTTRVSLYAVLLTAHRVGVFVSGFVARPGRYAGTASDSVLDYLVRAGGVDPSRGSYRDITIIHDGKPEAHVDLYQFLLTGQITGQSLREGDTIFVAKQNAMVAVDGAVRNNYLFELPPGQQSLGSEIVALARPLPSATHVVVSGSRNNKPFSTYLTTAELATALVFDQDQITFVSDRPSSTVRVRVEGSRIGPSFMVLPTDTGLTDALKQIQVDPALADLNSVYVLRQSIAAQQTRVINEALDRLERALFLAVSPTTGVSTIRASEAQLISNYIQRARRAPPDGRLVVTDDSGRPAELKLEDDDVIVIPAKSQVVMVSGEVLAPQAVLWRPGLSRQDYVQLAGGYSERGRSGKVLVRRANGSLILDRNVTLRPGDELVILPYIDPKFFQLGVDVLSLVYQVAISASVLHTLTN